MLMGTASAGKTDPYAPGVPSTQPLPAMDTTSSAKLAPNVGRTDRIVRVVAGLFLIVLALFVLDGVWALITGLASVVLIATAFVSFCPIYRMLGIHTTSTP